MLHGQEGCAVVFLTKCSSHALTRAYVACLTPLQKGRVQLTDLSITDSSEALLSGRKPPFRMLVRAVHKEARPLNVKHAVSEGFVVATRRTRTANKVRQGALQGGRRGSVIASLEQWRGPACWPVLVRR